MPSKYFHFIATHVPPPANVIVVAAPLTQIAVGISATDKGKILIE